MLEDLPEESEVLDKLTYKHPIYTQIKDQKLLRKYFKEQVLGYFLLFRDDTSDHLMRHRSVRSLYTDNQSFFDGDKRSVKSLPIQRYNSNPKFGEHISTFNTPHILIDLQSFTDVKQIKGSPVKCVSNCLFKGNLIWAASWRKDTLRKFNTVFLNFKNPEYKLISKKKKKLSGVESPPFMFLSGDFIIFAGKRGNAIYQLNTISSKFKQVADSRVLGDAYITSIAAMCGNEAFNYIIDEISHGHISVLDSNFKLDTVIPTGLNQLDDCELDMCVTSWGDATQHTIAICATRPASVRIVNQDGVMWQIDHKDCSGHFSPCSITSSADGLIYIADRGNDRVSMTIFFTPAT